VSTRPSDYRPPPDSPHVGITLPQHLTVTPSGAPRNKHKVCNCSRLPRLYQNHSVEGNLPNLAVRATTRTLHWTS